tara:strand:- start:504 stop:719 length:216 start_codon:yes stop_codon:yes gene_type:complete
MQVLVDQFKDDLGKTEADAKERLRYIFLLDFPPLHLLKFDLAKKYLHIGVAASALQIFDELGLVCSTTVPK